MLSDLVPFSLRICRGKERAGDDAGLLTRLPVFRRAGAAGRGGSLDETPVLDLLKGVSQRESFTLFPSYNHDVTFRVTL